MSFCAGSIRERCVLVCDAFCQTELSTHSQVEEHELNHVQTSSERAITPEALTILACTVELLRWSCTLSAAHARFGCTLHPSIAVTRSCGSESRLSCSKCTPDHCHMVWLFLSSDSYLLHPNGRPYDIPCWTALDCPPVAASQVAYPSRISIEEHEIIIKYGRSGSTCHPKLI